MATMMAMKAVDFSFQSIAGKLEKMLEEEAALLAGVEDDVRYIVAELKSITSFLTAMSTRRNMDVELQNWVQEVREVAYDAEDSIDEFNCRLRSTPYSKCGVKGFFNHFLRRIKSLKSRHVIASEIKKLKIQVEEIKKRHDRYSHTNEATSFGTATNLDMTDRYSDPRIIGHFVEETQLVGINQSRDTLIKWVMDENYPELTTISLIGFGGLGKTTLAKIVYDDPIIVGGHFQSRVWIAVSQNYSIKELLKKIIRQISINEQQIRDVFGCQDASLNTEQLLNIMDEAQLVKTIRDHLHGKRYMIVFDDVWSTEAWESLSIALPQGKEGSRVIVTSRSEEVANYSCSRNRQFIFKISPLSPEKSWELFCRKVFEAPEYSCPRELENVGKEILQKCDGLPLAIVTIGGLLASKPDKKHEEWKDFGDHLRLEIQTNDMLSKIHQILLLSYNDLSFHLKPCFLFLGIFPEDYEIRRKRLMRRWIAEGIVSGVGGVPAEKVAERCFNELVSRSLVQPSEFYYNGTVKFCRVHDMMLDVIISISRKENFVVLLNEHPTIPPQHQKIRRLSWQGGSSGLVPNTDLSHLRSFTATAFGEDVPLKDYRNQRLLRAIDLEGCSALFDLHPMSFSKLCLLKYLSLRKTGLRKLPDSIGDLQNLEFLDIRRTDIEELPNTIVKLQKLVYLLCEPPIFQFPKGIRKLKKLRVLRIACADNVQLLQEIGELVELENLIICVIVDDLESRMLEEISTLLSKLNGSLRSLKIMQISDSGLKRALHELASPPLLLSKIHILAKTDGLPTWFASLEKVVEITLGGTRLQLQDLQVLRNLHTLVKLVLRNGSFDKNGEDLVFDQGWFTHLKYLEIETDGVSFKKVGVKI
ncbi:disease resistance protein Pik-2-like isoform X1 [Zingiber officinale]|uniref:disease resistance protein Pik-2-like isoform X1 n=1 Tax=Zingiber officinale TaxID=94328 RepID=UPI001C4A8DD3|nr:disease resistance protein Pik-2-like isoform X1 [Zingiber officinale]